MYLYRFSMVQNRKIIIKENENEKLDTLAIAQYNLDLAWGRGLSLVYGKNPLCRAHVLIFSHHHVLFPLREIGPSDLFTWHPKYPLAFILMVT